MTHLGKTIWLGLIWVVCLSGCGTSDSDKKDADDSSTGSAGSDGTACVHGQTEPCTCEDGRSGSSTCLSGVFSSCVCDGNFTGGGAGGASGGAAAAGGTGGVTAGSGGSAGTEPAAKGPCCQANQGGGCDDATIEACVCAEGTGDPRCCTDQWDLVCAGMVDILGCGTCKGDCCQAAVAAPVRAIAARRTRRAAAMTRRSRPASARKAPATPAAARTPGTRSAPTW